MILTLVSQMANSYVRLLDFDQQLAITTHSSGSPGIGADQSPAFPGWANLGTGLPAGIGGYLNATVQVPLLERLIAQQENAISLLLGRNPGKITRDRTLAQLVLPRIPSGLPSDLLERRPDIQRAEQQLIAANALIGVAKAAFFPQGI